VKYSVIRYNKKIKHNLTAHASLDLAQDVKKLAAMVGDVALFNQRVLLAVVARASTLRTGEGRILVEVGEDHHASALGVVLTKIAHLIQHSKIVTNLDLAVSGIIIIN